ncbi:hypothetical protein, partial [Pseudooceanicola sp.]|uniref:hypothetical protein n=1 Tax=Pseudooceanicola sp. TaxID=1914328 RepID=UPI0026103577
ELLHCCRICRRLKAGRFRQCRRPPGWAVEIDQQTPELVFFQHDSGTLLFICRPAGPALADGAPLARNGPEVLRQAFRWRH